MPQNLFEVFFSQEAEAFGNDIKRNRKIHAQI